MRPTPSSRARPRSGPWLTPPAGTRDLLPQEAAERRALSRAVFAAFERHGYTLVHTPPFERIDVLERAGNVRAEDVLQFVDADGGDVAMFRPDITPQIARLVATRLRDWPAPYRLAYEGHVIRRPRGRARRQRQIPQAGIELIGLPGPEADAEVIEIAARALRDVGLETFVLELALVPILRGLIDRAPEEGRDELTQALGRKDRPALRELTRPLGAAGAQLVELAQLYGGIEVLAEARRVLGREASALGPLEALAKAAAARGLGPFLRVDLGEVRGFGYYTGPSFAALAEGPGEPIGGGGRYDELLGRFGRDLPGAGFALDLDHLAWALRERSRARGALHGIDLVVRAEEGVRLAATLRDAGLRVAELPSEAGHEAPAVWARAWSVPWLLETGTFGHRLVEVASERVVISGRTVPRDLAARVQRCLEAQKERTRWE
jgi:ATP phosphoribosyltransferase regulatory subunit